MDLKPYLKIKKMKKSLIIIIAFIASLSGFAQKPEKNISAELKYVSKYIDINGSKMHYIEDGMGDPILFLHGIPTNLYLWRNVMPEVTSNGRVIALDLVGYGKSEVPKMGGYGANNQFTYLEAFIEKMELKNVTLVVNDLGSVYGLQYAAKHPENVKGIVVAEGVVLPAYEWHKQLTFMQKSMFWMFRWDGLAKSMVVKKPVIQKIIVPMLTKRKLSKAEKLAYKEPYAMDKEKRKVVFEGPGPANFPKKKNLKPEIATDEFAIMMNDNAEKLDGTKIPMLILTSKPGFILRKKSVEYAKMHYPNLTIQHLGKGKHFLPEDHPKAMGDFINQWLKTIK
jgi:haloalkane dehalogenase